MPQTSIHFGRKLLVAVIVAAIIGFLWACFETGRNPMDLAKKLSKESPETTPTEKKPKPKETTPQPPHDPVVRPTPPTPAPVDTTPKKETPRPEAKTYSPTEMSLLFNGIDDLVRRGRFFEAREKLAGTSKLMVPGDQAGKFQKYEDRIAKYYELLLETTRGSTIDTPPLTKITVKIGGTLVVKLINQDDNAYYYETISGIRSKILRSEVESIKTLDPLFSAAELTVELKRLCDYRGLSMEGPAGGPYTYTEKPGKTVTGLHLFDLADFCARNGANDKLVGLFDEGLKLDPQLRTTVHEDKGKRMVQVFLFFLSIPSASDASLTLDILKKRYADTLAYKESVAEDSDVQAMVDHVLNRKTPQPIAKVTPPTPAPVPVAPTDPAPAVKEPEPVEAPTPAPVPAPVSVDGNPSSHPLPEGTPAKVAELVAAGDRNYNEAMKHLRNSDPVANPGSWAEENKKALEFFLKANQQGYLPAQELYTKSTDIPSSLLTRVRETTLRSSLCRKRSVRT